MPAVVLETPRGVRQIADADFPLTIGGADADIPLFGLDARRPQAWIDRSDGDLFIQSGDGAIDVVCNGTPITTSHWLHDGDVVQVAGMRLSVAAQAEGLRLSVEQLEADNVTVPPMATILPAAAVADEATSQTSVRPVEFRPRPLTGTKKRGFRLRPATLLVWVAVPLLAAIAWFLFGLRPVDLYIDPAPDRIEFRGGLLHWRLDGRHLLRPGPYTLIAEKAGYRPLEETVEVRPVSTQEFRYTLDKLPGFLIIDAGDVQGASVSVDGKFVGTTPLQALELSSGDHEIRIQAERFQNFAQMVAIEGLGVEQQLAVELIPGWASVTFRSEPAGAGVSIDGRSVGSTPVTADVGEGSHRFEYSLDGYKPHRGSLTVEANRSQALPPVRLEPVEGRLKLASVPPGAAVTVGDKYRGQTPLDLYLSPGRAHLIRLSKAGHDPQSREVVVASGETTQLELVLTGQRGEIEVVAQPADAVLYVDGAAHGAANQTLTLVAAAHEIEIRKEGYKVYRTTVTPRPGFPQSLRVDLELSAAKPEVALPAVVRSAGGQEMVLIAGGRFRMGASRREPGRRANEGLRDVELTRPFYLSTTEVSNREFRQFKRSHFSGRVDAFSLEIDHHPVARVSWEEAGLYCNWLSGQESLEPAYVVTDGALVAVKPPTDGYRLPTETEWAWAARFSEGPTPRKYPWGDSLPVPPESGNYGDVSARGLLAQVLTGYDDHFPATAPVDSFQPNSLGLFGIGGNVAEWVHDIYTIYPPAAGQVAVDPLGPEEGELHVIRGSSWMAATVTQLRLTYRDYGNKARPDVGFRIARYAK